MENSTANKLSNEDYENLIAQTFKSSSIKENSGNGKTTSKKSNI